MPSLVRRALWKLRKTTWSLTGYYQHTGERVCPEFPDENFLNHLEVYRFAAQFCKGARVLDVGCGTGYGTDTLLRQGASSGVGIDLSPDAIRYARRKYQSERLSFREMDAHTLEFAKDSFDFVLSTENLEHLSDPGRSIAEVRRVLAPGGTFLVATPNKEMFDPSQDESENPYHEKEFFFGELKALLESHFSEVAILETTGEPPTPEGRELRDARHRSGEVGLRPSRHGGERGNQAENQAKSPDVGPEATDKLIVHGRTLDTTHLRNSHSFFGLCR